MDNQLDWNTIQLESSSHTNRVEIKDGSEVSLKPKSDVALGDIISNTADIFFDFNEAIVTNTAMTEFVDPTSTEDFTALNFSIFPIPASGILSVQSKSNIVQIEIFDQLGQLVLTKMNANQIDLSSLNRGFYFCKVKGENGDAGIKKLVKE